MNPSSAPSHRPRRGVVAVVLDADRFLVIRRSVHVRAPGAYCFPGGGIEIGESEEDALAREMQEVSGVDASPIRRLWQNQTPSGVELAWWQTELRDAAVLVANPAEVESIHWLDAAQLRQMPGLLTTNRDFLDAGERSLFSLEQ